MARHKNFDWNMPEGTKKPTGSTMHEWQTIYVSLMMDIRDELQQLNRTLGCYRVQQMCDDVRRIERRLAKNMPINKRKAT